MYLLSLIAWLDFIFFFIKLLIHLLPRCFYFILWSASKRVKWMLRNIFSTVFEKNIHSCQHSSGFDCPCIKLSPSHAFGVHLWTRMAFRELHGPSLGGGWLNYFYTLLLFPSVHPLLLSFNFVSETRSRWPWAKVPLASACSGSGFPLSISIFNNLLSSKVSCLEESISMADAKSCSKDCLPRKAKTWIAHNSSLGPICNIG